MTDKLPGLISVYMEAVDENTVKEVGPFGILIWHRDGDGWTPYYLEEEDAPNKVDNEAG